MRELIEWSKSVNASTESWLVLGKGPSVDLFEEFDTSDFSILALNHVITKIPAKVAHIIDMDVVRDCAEALYQNAEYLLMPLHPHERFKPSKKTLEDYCVEIPVLDKLSKEGRLIWYNLHDAPPRDESPIITAMYFSAEAALDILASIGVNNVRSLGLDGGTSYGLRFAGLSDKTLLKNGRPSFDLQFQGMARVIRESNIFYAPLNAEAPIRVFVGTDETQMAGFKVLEHSIRQYASMSVEVIPIDNRGIPEPRNPDNHARTGFSFARFDIPRICSYRGRAIYLDADMQLFSDIAALWCTPMEGAQVLYSELVKKGRRIPQYSVMLIDCEQARWDVGEIIAAMDRDELDYRDLMYHLCIVPEEQRRADLPGEWNSLEFYRKGRTKLLHYTDMHRQPWVSRRNGNRKLWYRCLREALSAGAIERDFLVEEIEAGHLSPRLPKWAGLKLDRNFTHLEKSWVPPFKRYADMRNSSNWDGAVRRVSRLGEKLKGLLGR
ncbi:MAG: hypothetical protein ABJ308_09965 [Halieaceae bacterium]